MQLSDRVNSIKPSATLAVTARVKILKGATASKPFSAFTGIRFSVR